MHVTETNADGLKREFKIVVPAKDIESQLETRLQELSRTVRIPGFRPGKVPLTLMRKKYGSSVMGEVLERTVDDATRKAIDERGLRPALQPKVEVKEFAEGKDLEYTVALEVIPEIEPMDFSKLALERLKAPVDESEVDKALERIAGSRKKTEALDKPRAAKKDDVVVIDFVGRIGGEAFQGGSATDFNLELGSGAFIPGFEDQLVGAKAGETRTVKVAFPADYGAAELAGKDAEFETTVKDVLKSVPAAIDDELAKGLGLESLDALRNAMREEYQREYDAVSRMKLKRVLLDKLSDGHDFPVPQGMVDAEFEAIWRQLKQDLDGNRERLDPEDREKSEDQLKQEYRAIAERRVRLGLLLSEVGRANDITVAPDDLNKALAAEARRYPGQERQVIEFYRNNPDALNSLRAPIYEDKVIDFILEMAKVSEKTVSPEELMKEPADAETQDEAAAETSGKKARGKKK